MASVAVGKKRRVPALGWWLMVVGTVRLAFTWSCFFGSAALCSATYSQAQVSDVHGRTVGVWTLLSCTLCFLCAFNLDNKPLCLATFLSFVYAYGYFVVEYLVYHSVGASTLAALGFFADSDTLWLGTHPVPPILTVLPSGPVHVKSIQTYEWIEHCIHKIID
ncbi:ergosterol biosynthetic protein 28 isoform X1 [Setaria italica]|uniref:ergosterol biosynthetic protein 28 isoform X1 n=1 Tax=Setaria italica TaxID=4555 RepID=UPI000351432B|nr:ergosterol biosynthetic protein 28 isoform X1 [Setaria italica]